VATRILDENSATAEVNSTVVIPFIFDYNIPGQFDLWVDEDKYCWEQASYRFNLQKRSDTIHKFKYVAKRMWYESTHKVPQVKVFTKENQVETELIKGRSSFCVPEDQDWHV